LIVNCQLPATISFAYFQTFWLKFKRKFFQYFTQAFKNPRWFLMFCLTRIHFLRNLVIFVSRQPVHQISTDGGSLFEELNVEESVKTLRNDGLCLGINLPRTILDEILEFSGYAIYLGNADSQFPFSIPEKEREELKCRQTFVTAHHLNPSSLCPAVEKVEKDHKLWEIAAQYLETNPVLLSSRLKWTFAVGKTVSENMRGAFRFHYDLEDYRFIKFFFYLTDVDELSSPHACVKGTHKRKKLRHQFSLIRERDDNEIIEYYGSNNVETICGKAGLGFVEDFYCFHKGTLPVYKNRLVLEVKFAMNDYGFY